MCEHLFCSHSTVKIPCSQFRTYCQRAASSESQACCSMKRGKKKTPQFTFFSPRFLCNKTRTAPSKLGLFKQHRARKPRLSFWGFIHGEKEVELQYTVMIKQYFFQKFFKSYHMSTVTVIGNSSKITCG